MAGEANQNPLNAIEPAIGDNKSDSRMDRDASATSSSSTLAAIKMADNQIPEIADF
jgi:hypothetical protein